MEFKINVDKQDLKKSGVYIIKNNINNRVYIGKTESSFIERAMQHKNFFRNNRANSEIKSFIENNKDAVFSFEVLEKQEDRENFYIEKFKRDCEVFNINSPIFNGRETEYAEKYNTYKGHGSFVNNYDLSIILKQGKQTSNFCKFIEMTKQGYYRKIKSNKPRDSLYGAYLHFCQDGLLSKGLCGFSNSEIHNSIRKKRELKEFADFLKMTPNGLRKRLDNNSLSMSLYHQWVEFLAYKSSKNYRRGE